MACNTSMVRWHRYNSYGNNINANYEYRWHAVIKISSQDTAEDFAKIKGNFSKISFYLSSLTLICAVFYKIFGMNYFDSLTHSMTTIATGGFSNYNDSIGHFNSTLIEMNAVIFIILGSIPFISYIKYLNGDKSIFYKDAQISFL